MHLVVPRKRPQHAKAYHESRCAAATLNAPTVSREVAPPAPLRPRTAPSSMRRPPASPARDSTDLWAQPGRVGQARPVGRVLEPRAGRRQQGRRTTNNGNPISRSVAPVVRRGDSRPGPHRRCLHRLYRTAWRLKRPEHNLLGVDIAETVSEPRVGGALSTTAGSTAAGTAGRVSWATSRGGGCCAVGTSVRAAD